MKSLFILSQPHPSYPPMPPPDPLRVKTMQDVADAAAVHRTTVSLALRNHPSIPLVTRERIKNIATSMGYRVNPLVAALMSQQRTRRSNAGVTTIGLITADSDSEQWRKILSYREMFGGAMNRARELGCRVEEFSLTHPPVSGERLRQILYTRGIRGLLIPPLPAFPEGCPLDLADFCAVSLGYDRGGASCDAVDIDFHLAMQTILRRVQERGYRQPGLVLHPDFSARTSHRWLSSYLGGCWLNFRQAKPLLLMASYTDTADNLTNNVLPWVRTAKPDVVIANVGNHGRQWLESLAGLPHRPGLVTMAVRQPEAGVAGIDQQNARSGALAVELLLGKLQRNEMGSNSNQGSHFVQGFWRDGSSLPHRRVSRR
jgi:LacI family transcriptional regulator